MTAEIKRVRDVLDAAGFTTESLQDVVVRGDSHGSSWILRRGDTPLHTLAALFIVGDAVPLADVERAIAPSGLEDWRAAGMLEVEGDMARATVQLGRQEGLIISSDFVRRGHDLPADHVLGVGRATLTLSHLTVRQQNRSALDLGTGSGLLALQAARHTDHVTGVDRSPRALRFARLNCELNATGLELLEGNMFDPVEGRTFDLIVSNPPFVISPEASFDFRDSGERGDAFCRSLARKAPKHLVEGGWFQMLFNWPHFAGRDWKTDVSAWFEGTGCDAWILRSDTSLAESYARTWIGEVELETTDTFRSTLEDWLAFYRREGIEAVSLGALTMRKRDGAANWIRFDDVPESMRGPSGAHVQRIFAAEDFLQCLADEEALLDARLMVSPDVRLDMTSALGPSGWVSESGRLRLDRGLAWSGEIDGHGVQMLAHCNGMRTVRELLTAMAGAMDVSVESLTPPALAIVRKLVERGFVIPRG